MSEQLYTVEVFSTNSIIFFRNKRVRTPVVCRKVFENEIEAFKVQLKTNNLDYQISIEDDNFIKKQSSIIKKQPEVVVEELFDSEKESNSTLDRLLKNEKDD